MIRRLRTLLGRLACRWGRHAPYVAARHHFGRDVVGETWLCRRGCGWYERRSIPNRRARRRMGHRGPRP